MTSLDRRSIVPLGALALAVAAGCSSTGTGTPATSASASTSTTTMPTLTVDDVLARLAAAGATSPVIVTAETDSNRLLGRPGGYTARATFALPGGDPTAKPDSTDRGGAIEIWPDAASAKKRSEFIQSTLAAAPVLGTEYHYLAGQVLVRVSGKVTPANAKKIEAAVAQLPH